MCPCQILRLPSEPFLPSCWPLAQWHSMYSKCLGRLSTDSWKTASLGHTSWGTQQPPRSQAGSIKIACIFGLLFCCFFSGRNLAKIIPIPFEIRAACPLREKNPLPYVQVIYYSMTVLLLGLLGYVSSRLFFFTYYTVVTVCTSFKGRNINLQLVLKHWHVPRKRTLWLFTPASVSLLGFVLQIKWENIFLMGCFLWKLNCLWNSSYWISYIKAAKTDSFSVFSFFLLHQTWNFAHDVKRLVHSYNALLYRGNQSSKPGEAYNGFWLNREADTLLTIWLMKS